MGRIHVNTVIVRAIARAVVVIACIAGRSHSQH